MRIASYDVLTDSLARSDGDMWLKFSSDVTIVTCAVLTRLAITFSSNLEQ